MFGWENLIEWASLIVGWLIIGGVALFLVDQWRPLSYEYDSEGELYVQINAVEPLSLGFVCFFVLLWPLALLLEAITIIDSY